MRNPINSLLCLISVFFHLIFLLFSLNIEFLALIFLIIYIGAIAILFLFVIMMFNLKELTMHRVVTNVTKVELKVTSNMHVLFGTFLMIILYTIIHYYMTKFIFTNPLPNVYGLLKTINLKDFMLYKFNDIFVFSTLFYTYYVYLFLLSGLILLTAMLGSIVLAMSTQDQKEKIGKK